MSSYQSQIPNPQQVRKEVERPTRIPFSGLLTNKLLTKLSGAEFTQLLPYLEPASFRTGDYVFELGQQISYIYFPETLVTSQLCYLKDGSSTGVSIVGKEGLLGLSAILGSNEAPFWSLATIGGMALRIRLDEFKQEFGKGGSLHKLVLGHAYNRMNHLAQRTVCNGRHRVEERLCSFLLMIHDRAPDVDLPLTHEAISAQLGTRRAGVTNLCNVLRDHGIISYHRGKITILDRSALEKASCECYRRID